MTDESKPRRPRKRIPAAVIEVREMQLSDIPAVFELGQRLFTAEEWPTLYRSWDDHEIALLYNTDNETCLVAVAKNPERIVGFALGRIMEKPRSAWKYGWLLWLGIAPEFKRRGMANRLVNQLTSIFIENDARIMLVDTDKENHGAVRFFRKQGFGQEVWHVYLSKNLENHPKYIEKHDSRNEGEE